MSKRRAGTELTHDNWDQEEELEEEAGVFQTADKTTLAKRPIKKAKRRFPEGEGQGTEGSSNPFGAFKGFTEFSAAAATTKKPDLSFGSRENKPKVTLTPAESTAPVISSFVIKSSPQSTTSSSSKLPKSVNGNASSSSTSSALQANMNPDYSVQLKSLNQSVSAWIQQHVNANPLCDLTPVFEDYKKHLHEIETKNLQKANAGSKGSGDAAKAAGAPMTSVTSPTKSTPASSTLSGFSFTKSSSADSSVTTTTTSSLFSSSSSSGAFGSGLSGFSFGKSTTASSDTSAIGAVGQVKPFAFGVGQPTSSSSGTETKKEGDGDEDEPPKVEFKQVEEKDALYSKKCKLFYKKDNAYKDRGVGMLHLKKVGDTGQMLLRADTNLGNVILNIGVHSSMPATRNGKNNVMIMAAMNPPVHEKCPKCKKKYIQPQESNRCESGCTPDVEPLLLRVKTGDDADQLLAEINKLKEA